MTEKSDILSLHEESATIGVRAQETGRVRVDISTRLEESHVSRDLMSTEASVCRVPVDRMIGPGEAVPVTRTDGDTTIVPVFEEVAVVELRLVLKEELHITQTRTTETVDIPLSLRRQTADIHRNPVQTDTIHSKPEDSQ